MDFDLGDQAAAEGSRLREPIATHIAHADLGALTVEVELPRADG